MIDCSYQMYVVGYERRQYLIILFLDQEACFAGVQPYYWVCLRWQFVHV